MQQPFLVMRTNEKIHTNKIKAKSLAHLFKGGRFPKGGAIWSSSSEDEIRLPTANIIKTTADKLKIPKAACTLSSKACK